MDPQACLLGARAALDEGDLEAFREAMRSYQHWRRTGGFEPTVEGRPGDEFAGLLWGRFRPLEGHTDG